MRGTIRIVQSKPELTFAESLEARARELVSFSKDENGETSPSSHTARDLALTLDHIERQELLQRQLHSNLTMSRFYVYNELIQQKRETQYRPYRPNSIDNLKARLADIDRELRMTAVRHEESLQRLHDRLLYHLQRHIQLRNGNGDRKNSN